MSDLNNEAQALKGLLGDLTTLTVKDLVGLWKNVSSADDAVIEQALKVAVPQIVMPYVNAAAEATAQWYDELAPDVDFKATPFVDMPEERIAKSVGWAVNKQGDGTPEMRLAGSAKRMVFDGSRQTVLHNASKENVRWVRHAQPDACLFCKVLATRADVYTSFQSATKVVGKNTAITALKAKTGAARGKGKRKVGSTGYHDHCRCVPVPVRKGTIYVQPSYVGAWDDMYAEARKRLRQEDGIFAPDIRDIVRKMRVLDKESAVADVADAAQQAALNAATKTELNVGVRAALQRQAELAAQKAAEAREAIKRARLLAQEDANFQLDLEITAGQRDALARMAQAAADVDGVVPVLTNPRQIYQDIADWIAAEKFFKKSEAMKKGAQTKKLKKYLAAEAQWKQAVEDWLTAENTVLWLKAEKFYIKSEAMKKGAQTKKLKKWLQAEADWKAKQAQLAAQQAAQSAQSAVSNPFAALLNQGPPKISPFNGGPDPLTLKASGKKLGGVNGAEIYVAPDGSEWVVKFTSKFINELEVAVAQLQQAAGLATPDFYSLTINGKAASVQRFFDGATDAFPNGKSLSIDNLSDVDLLTLQQHQVLDWLMSNHDAHSGNWVKTKSGNLVGIDKGQSFKFFGKDKLAWDYVPVSPLGSNVPTYKTLWQQWMKGSTADLLDPGESGNPLNTFILNLMSLDDQEFRDLFSQYAKAALAQGKLSTGDVSVFLDKLELRKGSLLEDFKAMYAKGLAEREKVVGPKPQPSGGAIQNLIGGPTPAQAVASQKYTLAEVAQLKADGKMITLTEGDLTDTLAAAGLDSKTQKLYINGWVDEWANKNGYDPYTSVEIPNKIDELDAAITAKKKQASGGPFGNGAGLDEADLQNFKDAGLLGNITEDAILNSVAGLDKFKVVNFLDDYAMQKFPGDLQSSDALFKKLYQQHKDAKAGVPSQAATGNFIDLAIQQGSFDSMTLVQIQDMISKAITNDQMGTLSAQGASQLFAKLDQFKAMKTLDEDTFLKIAQQLNPSDQTTMAIAYAADLTQANYLAGVLQSGSVGAQGGFTKEVKDLWAGLNITDAPSGAADLVALQKVKDLKDAFGPGSGFQPLKGIASNNGLYLKDPQLYENFDLEIGIQYLTQDQLIMGLTKVVKDGNDALADQWIVKYAAKKFDSNTTAGQQQIVDEIDALKKKLADEKAKLKVGSSSSPGSKPSYSGSTTEKQLPLKELANAESADTLKDLSEGQLLKSVFFYEQTIKEEWITKWGQAKGLTQADIDAAIAKAKPPAGSPVINPTVAGETPNWDRVALQPAKGRHKLPDSVQPDPTAAPGTSDNPHIFMVNDDDDWKAVGSYYTDQSKYVWESGQMRMISDYTGGGYRTMNATLRRGGKPSGYTNMDKAFKSDNVKVTDDWMILTRGDGAFIAGVNKDFPTFDELTAQVGKEVDVPSYVSTSISETPKFGGSCRIIFRLPPGSRMLYVDGGPQGGGRLTTCPNEREAVLPRGQKVKVLEAKPSTNSRYTYDVVVEVLEQPI